MERWLLTMLGKRALHIATLVVLLSISFVSSFPSAALKDVTAHLSNKTRSSLLLQKIKDHSVYLNTDSSSSHSYNMSDISRKLLLDNVTLSSDDRNSRYTSDRRYKRYSYHGSSHVDRFLYSTAKLKQLYCRTGYRLAIYPNGTINGTKRIDNPYCFCSATMNGLNAHQLWIHHELTTLRSCIKTYALLSISARSFGAVYIKGVYSSLYVCMDSEGTLYGSAAADNECLFGERLLSNWYTTFSSKTYPTRRSKRKWFLALNKDGSARSGQRTKAKHNMAQFLPI